MQGVALQATFPVQSRLCTMRSSSTSRGAIDPGVPVATLGSVLPALIGFIMGAFVGSFLNVCIHRLPRNESVVMPPSRCYACGTGVRWHDNLPILSWLILRGRCRFCGSPFSIRYMLGELAVAVVSAAVMWWAFVFMPAHGSPPWMDLWQWDQSWVSAAAAGAALVLVWWLWVAAMIDYDHTIIPDELTKPMQLLAPGLALLLPVNADLGWLPIEWFFTQQGVNRVPDPWGGVHSVLWIAIPCLVFLALSVPLARWIYSSFCPDEVWSDDDHRGFRVGVFWFVAVSVVHLGVLLGLALITAGHQGPEMAPWLAMLIQGSQAVMGSLVGWLALYLVGLLGTMAFRKNALGFGDVKFLAPIGAVLGPEGILYTFFLAALVGAAIGLPRRFMGGGREIPFGPFLALGAVLAALFGHRIHVLIFG